MTIEATIVSTVVIFCVVMLIYLGFLLYEQVRLETIATVAAERGAMVYSNQTRDMYVGKIDPGEFATRNPYWRILDSNKDTKVNKIESYINTLINSRNVIKQTNKTVDVEVIDWLIYKKINVNLTGQYTVPIGGIFKLFGLQNPFPVTAEAQAVFLEPAELVRNADLGIDILREVDNDYFGSKGKEFLEKVSKGFNKIVAFFNK